MTHKIVVGVDGSDHGDAALRWALREAEVHGGEITAVFAWQMPFLDIPARSTATRSSGPARSSWWAPWPRSSRTPSCP